MTLANCKKRLKLAVEKGDVKEIAILNKRIAHKSTLPQYAPVVIPKVEVKKNDKKR